MPWSEWIQSDPDSWGGFDKRSLASTIRDAVIDGAGNSGGALSSAHAAAMAAAAPDEASVYGSPPTGLGTSLRLELARDGMDPDMVVRSRANVTRSESALWYTVEHIAAAQGVASVADVRDWFPRELWDLTEGVDFAVRPDRTGTENDAYVQYEPGGSAEHLEWVGSARVNITYVNRDDVPVAVELVHATAGAPPEEPPPSGSGGTAVAAPQWVDGAVVISHTGSTGSSSATVPLALPPTPQVGLGLRGVGGGVYLPQSGTEHRLDWFATQTTSLTAMLTMPRWRYWIPGPAVRPPLRQRQRTDGLGLSGAPHWRGHASRQSSNRWAGHL